jgi:hypothetical protein
MCEAKFVEYNESPDAPQSNSRDAPGKYPKRRMNHVDMFRKLPSRNEIRVRQAAETLKDRLRRIVAICAIYQAQAARLARDEKRIVK